MCWLQCVASATEKSYRPVQRVPNRWHRRHPSRRVLCQDGEDFRAAEWMCRETWRLFRKTECVHWLFEFISSATQVMKKVRQFSRFDHVAWRADVDTEPNRSACFEWLCSAICGCDRVVNVVLTVMLRLRSSTPCRKSSANHFKVRTDRTGYVLHEDCFVERFLRAAIGSSSIMLGVVGIELLKVPLDLVISDCGDHILFLSFVVFDSIEEAWDRVHKWLSGRDAIAHNLADSVRLALLLELPFRKALEADAQAASFMKVAQSASFGA